MSSSKKPIIKTPQQIAEIREAGKYLNELLLLIKSKSHAGVSLIELEQYAVAYIASHPNIKGCFKGYHGFPANLCLSVNDCLVHGIPDKTVLKNADLLKIDAGITYKKGIADSAISIVVG